MKPLHYRSVSSKGDGRPRLTHHHKDWWNGTKWMRRVWRNGGMKFVVGENAKNLPRPRFVHHETHMEGPRRELGTPAVGGERLTACATRPPRDSFISPKLVIYSWDMINLLNHRRLARWIKRRACDVGEAKEGMENKLWRRWSNGWVGEWAELKHFTILLGGKDVFRIKTYWQNMIRFNLTPYHGRPRGASG